MPDKYHTIALDKEPFLEKCERTDSEETLIWTGESEPLTSGLRNLSIHWVWLAHAVLLSASALFFALSFCARTTKTSDLEYTRRFSAWSPAISAVGYETRRFDLPPFADGPFVGKGDDVDAKWDGILAPGGFMISEEELGKLGLDPDESLRITDPRNGEPGYRVAMEVFHQLHCLNLLRQNMYKDHYTPLGGDMAAAPNDLRNHLDHCIDALRQFVMCQGDVGVFSYNDPFNDGHLKPNYNTPHTCRNFDSIRQWAVDNVVPQGPDEPHHH
ncbi:hypothetical protein F4808DRAFT_331271 [Astrocystis sublimbata]|nr:hypothetical protein F4808DRAFT_331271 [Astrocystis sublimbata]